MRSIPDVEVTFTFLGVRKYPSKSGYRPAHRITDQFLTTGSHQYFGADCAPLCGTIEGSISFITPEEYPHTLWTNKVIAIQEGERVIGYARIRKILNPILRNENRDMT